MTRWILLLFLSLPWMATADLLRQLAVAIVPR